MCNIIESLMQVREKLAKLRKVASDIYVQQSESRGDPEAGIEIQGGTQRMPSYWRVLELQKSQCCPFTNLQETARAILAQSRLGGYLGCTDGSPVGREFVSRLGLPSDRQVPSISVLRSQGHLLIK